MAYKIKKSQVRAAVENCNGTYVSLGRELRIGNGVTAKKYLHKYKDLTALFEKKKEELLDVAEDTLMHCLTCDSDKVRLSTATFILRTVGRERWGEGKDTEERLVDIVEQLIVNAQSS